MFVNGSRQAHLIQWCCPLGYLVIICLLFCFCLDFFQDLFLRNGYVVLFSVMIFFVKSTFILLSCVNSCFVCGVSVLNILCFNSVKGALAFQHSLFRFGLGGVLIIFFSIYLSHIFIVCQGQKTNLSSISF